MKKGIAVCFAALCCAAVFVSAAAEPKTGLAVYVTGDKTENEKKTLANEITNSLVKSGRYTAAERSGDFFAALAKERGAQRAALSDSRVMEAAKEHGAEHLCVADIAGVLGTFYVSIRVIDLETGEVEAVGSAYSGLLRPEDFVSVSESAAGSVFTIAQPKKPAPAPAPPPEVPPAPPPPPPPPLPPPPPEIVEVPAAPMPAPALPEIAQPLPEAPPVDASFYYNQGNANIQSNNNDGAIANYTEALKLDPRLIYALIARGAAYYSKGDYQSAVDDYSRTLELEPNDAGVFNSRGNAYRQMGNYQMAIADYEAALRIDPNNAEAREALELIKLDKSGAGEETTVRKPLFAIYKDGMQYGVSAAFSGQYLNNVYGYSHNTANSHRYDGMGFRIGVALTLPLNDWLMVETELNYIYRTMDNYWNSFSSDVYIDESAVSIPLLARASTPLSRFNINFPLLSGIGVYGESGIMLQFPFGTRFGVDEADSKPIKIKDRNSELQFVVGGGATFEFKGTWYAGYRLIPSFTDFAGDYGWLLQHEFYCSLMFSVDKVPFLPSLLAKF